MPAADFRLKDLAGREHVLAAYRGQPILLTFFASWCALEDGEQECQREIAKVRGEANEMQRVGFVLKVKADRLEEYKRRHREVWPEMLQALRETGWHNYSLFMREDGLLFGYFETPDFEAARAGMAQREVNARWQAEMAPFFEALDGQRPDEGLLVLEEVFHLD